MHDLWHSWKSEGIEILAKVLVKVVKVLAKSFSESSEEAKLTSFSESFNKTFSESIGVFELKIILQYQNFSLEDVCVI